MAGNSGVKGKKLTTSSTSASGMFTLAQQFNEVAGSAWPNMGASVTYIIVAGGGGGGSSYGGGGGAGGFIDGTNGASTLAGTYNIVVGAGGAGGTYASGIGGYKGVDGGDSSFNGNTAIGGGGGGGRGTTTCAW